MAILDQFGNAIIASGALKTFSGLSVNTSSQFDDGSPNAPVGASIIFNSGSTDYASLVAAQPKRPAWNIAGINYAVGIPASARPLKVVGTNPLPTGLTIAASGPPGRLNAAANTLVDGWDFSNGDWRIDINGSNVTVQNCKFVCASASGDSFIQANGGGFTGLLVKNCEMDAAYITFGLNGSTTLVRGCQGGTWLYNYIVNTISDVWDMDAGVGFDMGTITLKYNVVRNVGKGGHPDIFQPQSSRYNFKVSFNTVIQDDLSLNGSQGFALQDNNSFVYGGNDFGNNVALVPQRLTNANNIAVNGLVLYSTANFESGATLSIHDNYVCWQNDTFQRGTGSTGVTKTNNFDMRTGAAVS